MSKKNLLLIAAGYVAGGVIASFYNKKKPKDLKEEIALSKEEGK
jgi:hypothetical protein